METDKILEQINTATYSDGEPMEVFSPNYICSETKHKLNWSGMHLNSFRLRVYTGEVKNTRLKVGLKTEYKITKKSLLDWIQKTYAKV